jgi:hypothetical protein
LREAARRRTRNPRTSSRGAPTRSNLPLFPEKTAIAGFIRRHKLMEFEKSRLSHPRLTAGPATVPIQPALHPAPEAGAGVQLRIDLYLPRFGFRRPRALRRLPQYPNNDPSQRRHEHITREDNRQNKSPARAHVSANMCGCVSAASVKNALHQEQPLLQCSIPQEEKQFCSKFLSPGGPNSSPQSAVIMRSNSVH